MISAKTSDYGPDALKRALYEAGAAIAVLFPEELEERVTALILSRDYEAFLEAENALYDAVIALLESRHPDLYRGYDWERRVPCPLCRAVYSVPLGMRDHLMGRGNIFECGPMRALVQHAWDVAHDSMKEAAERQAAHLAARRAAGPVHRFALDEAPRLFDEPASGLWGERRTVDEIPAVEAALAALGFARVAEGIEVRYELARPDVYVLADPRRARRIDFNAYLPEILAPVAPARRGRRTAKVQRRDSATFHLLDSWTKDRPQKLEARIQAAIGSLRNRSETARRAYATFQGSQAIPSRSAS